MSHRAWTGVHCRELQLGIRLGPGVDVVVVVASADAAACSRPRLLFLVPATSALGPSTAIVSPRTLIIIRSCARGPVLVNLACTSEPVHAGALICIVASGVLFADVAIAAAWRAARYRRSGCPGWLYCGARSHYVSLQTCSLSSATAQTESSASLATLSAVPSPSPSAPVLPSSASLMTTTTPFDSVSASADHFVAVTSRDHR
ncbi:unnamed protein product (mitochondrion) [Plasmodiophora brassicae]|uniref:Uncharacterized protein n=1 Tax=Plasmodiophora brassicae TaxID=37360 RepID=A0A3P3YND5_PLABS|nr:unnamed protein product [Plasmodiophora brassicae]